MRGKLRIDASGAPTRDARAERARQPGAHLQLLDRRAAATNDEGDLAGEHAQLAAGRHLVLSPGLYALSHALVVPHRGQVVLGLGFATLTPQNGSAALVLAALCRVHRAVVVPLQWLLCAVLLLRSGKPDRALAADAGAAPAQAAAQARTQTATPLSGRWRTP